jgi:DNA-binding response OmpR family regulator
VEEDNQGMLKNHKWILLGEDDIDDQEFLQEIFSSIDNSVLVKSLGNGKQIISYLRDLDNSLPSLIILDYNLPELNGAEILNILRDDERYNSVPKLIWSTSNSVVYKSLCLELGASDYVVKPSNIASLKEVARYMLSFANTPASKLR